LVKDRPSDKNPLITIVEISEFETGKESDHPEEKVLPVESQPKRPTDNPGIGQNTFHQGKGTRREAGIGMEKKQDVTRGMACPRIHLDAAAPSAADHPGMGLGDFHCSVKTTPVNDNELKLTLLVIDTVQAREDISGFVQCRNNNRNFHRSIKKRPHEASSSIDEIKD